MIEQNQSDLRKKLTSKTVETNEENIEANQQLKIDEKTYEDYSVEDFNAETNAGKETVNVESFASQSLVLSNPKSIPDYNGEDYIYLNGNIPMFTEYDYNHIIGEEYSELDSLGRCGVAVAMIDKTMMPTEERGSIGMIKPSGWHTVKYPDVIADNYLYNRCHLIGYALTGQNANELNLITGTRYFNVSIMLPFENEVARCLETTNNHVLYRVTPFFTGDELVARGVEMEAYSVEDNGKSICFHVFCYNIQPGIGIDYLTGKSWVVQ